MRAFNDIIKIRTRAGTDIVDITPQVSERVEKASLREGAAILFVTGSTAGITTIEFESGAVNDLKRAIERIAPEAIYYEHNEKWGDGNGHSHVRAALLGPSLYVPVVESVLTLGTWQQIVVADFDNRPRERHIFVRVTGE